MSNLIERMHQLQNDAKKIMAEIDEKASMSSLLRKKLHILDPKNRKTKFENVVESLYDLTQDRAIKADTRRKAAVDMLSMMSGDEAQTRSNRPNMPAAPLVININPVRGNIEPQEVVIDSTASKTDEA